jgi:hypothetical protein
MQVGEWLRPSCPHLRQAQVFDPSCRNPLDKRGCARHIVLMKKLRRGLEGAAIGGGLSVAIIGFLAFAHAQAHLSSDTRCFVSILHTQWPKWIGCAMAAQESLAGGLIGFAGVIFAAWLAYSGAQDQLRNTNEQLRKSERLRAEERVNETARDIRTLNAARNYLTSFAKRFPGPNQANFTHFNFHEALLQLYQRAHVYVSESASAAPGEFGIRILTVMWRIQFLAENVKVRTEKNLMSFHDLKEEIRDCIIEIWRIIDDLADEICRRESQYAERIEELKRLSS